MSDAMTNHSDTESLAAFVDGRLGREEREAVTKHLQTCGECNGFVREAAAFEQEEEAAAFEREEEAAARKPGRTWWAAAVVAIVVLASAPFVPRFLQGQKLEKREQQLFAAIADSKERKVEARFGGQHSYARLKPTMRDAGEHEKSLEEMSVDNAADELALASADDTSPAGRRAAALAMTVTSPAKALAILNGIPEQARDAAIWNDIAALQNHLGDYSAALAAVNEALRLDPKMPEALFNRAAILKRLEDPGAAAAWQDYLAVEPQGQWADEAKRKIGDLPQPQ